MSGGVDSTVSAYILKKQGHEVIGVNFAFADVGADTIRPRMGELCEPASIDPELEEIAKKLDIKIIYKDFRKEFKDKIIASFVNDYEHGITPNPCAICNGIMKFEKLLQVMREENCDMVATGHYANVVVADTNATHIVRGDGDRYCIKKSENQQKDQSYMLYRLNQDQLSHIIFPIGNMNKPDVRKIALEIGLKVADKKDSQDVCFIKNISYQEFIKQYEFGSDYREKIANGKLKEEEMLSKPFLKKGEFVDLDGKVLGFHNGIINYTIGQRKGLNIAFGERKFVANIDVEKNHVVLANNQDLYKDYFFVSDLVFSGISETELNDRIMNYESFANVDNIKNIMYAKLRYRHDGTLCKTIERVDSSLISSSEKNNLKYYFDNKMDQLILKCHMLEPVRAITPGQSAVFYDELGQVMFGGRIL